MKKAFILIAAGLTLLAPLASAQTTLSIGDISILGFNANAPDNFDFVVWTDLSAGTVIKFSDNGFLGGSTTGTGTWNGSENFTVWTASSAVAAGTVIRLENGAAASIGSNTGNLSGLSSSGDQIFAYQGTGTVSNFSGTGAGVTFSGSILYGLNYQGDAGTATWATSGSINSNTSFLPSEISSNSVTFGSAANRAQYTGTRTFSSVALARAAVDNAANWTAASGAGTITLDTTAFTVVPEPHEYGLAFAGMLLALVVMRRRRAV